MVVKPCLVYNKEYNVLFLVILGVKDYIKDFIKCYLNLRAHTLKSKQVGKFAAYYLMKT